VNGSHRKQSDVEEVIESIDHLADASSARGRAASPGTLLI
jgi:hypothetical protein